MTPPFDGRAKRFAVTPSFVPALKELAAAATAKGSLPEAAQALEKAVALRPN